MAFLIDTSILGRLANFKDPHHSVATAAIAELHRWGELLHITPQNLVEFRNIATRLASVNGLGLTIQETETYSDNFERIFPRLDDAPGIFPVWKSIVAALGVIGKQVHDARLVAVCHVHAVSHILTFNVAHFARFANFGPGLVVVDPRSI